jgi:alkylated DNA nucleotide flippase Atl1
VKSRTPWSVKFEKPAEARIVDVPPKMTRAWGPGKMVIATPKLIAALVRRVPKGKLTTTKAIMERLARDHQCDSACPMTTGIFLRIVAEVAEEEAQAGKRVIAPYWRVLKSDGSLNEKFPGGAARQAGQLRAEGHKIDSSRKVPRVADYEQQLVKL